MVDFSDVQRAASDLEGVAHKTPVLTSKTANEKFGAQLYFKCENFQRAGAFKFRGAYFALSQLSADQRSRGVLTYSSGNHAQALALAGKLFGVQIIVIMPSDAPALKVAATKGYGAEVILYDRDETSRETLGSQISAERGLTVIPPYDHVDIVAGQGTVAKELFENVGELDYLMVCAGGGGLLSGSSLSAKALSPNCKVIGVEPEAGDDICRSFRSGQLETCHNPETIADGARTPSASELTFSIIKQNVFDMLSVKDSTLIECTKFYAERMKIIVEPTGCLSLAALWENQLDVSGKKVGVIISGGNVDLATLAEFWRFI
ncbi:MAG: threo-3-hydroxy-L-aspartate ammonia-lyase [Fimbriimonadaceae bacterium]|nr:MAG: threo-3-hydroxy-L-aspartate ammonia-lyase [Fimbriimonadaceae bacterium]